MVLNLLESIVLLKMGFTDQTVVATLMNVKFMPAVEMSAGTRGRLVMMVMKCGKRGKCDSKYQQEHNRY